MLTSLKNPQRIAQGKHSQDAHCKNTIHALHSSTTFQHTNTSHCHTKAFTCIKNTHTNLKKKLKKQSPLLITTDSFLKLLSHIQIHQPPKALSLLLKNMHLLSITLDYISIPKHASIQTHLHIPDMILGHTYLLGS